MVPNSEVHSVNYLNRRSERSAVTYTTYFHRLLNSSEKVRNTAIMQEIMYYKMRRKIERIIISRMSHASNFGLDKWYIFEKIICFAPFIDYFSIVHFFQCEFKSDSTLKTLLFDNNGDIKTWWGSWFLGEIWIHTLQLLDNYIGT